MAVPHPGPITSRSFASPRVFSSTSSSTDTWSLNRNTCIPEVSARWASRVAYSPGTDTSATLLPGWEAAADTSVREGATSAEPPPPPDSRATSPCSAVSSAEDPTASSDALTAMITSPGPASTETPIPESASRLAGVPMATSAPSTPSVVRIPLAIPMSRMESAYRPRMTRVCQPMGSLR